MADEDGLQELRGRLEHVPLEGGYWQLRFGDSAAPHGGLVVLGTPGELATGFADGDEVSVRGHVDPFGATVFMSGTRYVLESIEHAGG